MCVYDTDAALHAAAFESFAGELSDLKQLHRIAAEMRDREYS
jgi:hypothetical protein